MRLTNEQLEIIYSDNDYIYVSARAGTGKTSTLLEFVKIRKADKFLYIVYNSAIKEEALSKFPSRVKIHTIHSLAYENIGYKYKNKLVQNLTIEDIFSSIEYFKEKDISDEKILKEGYIVLSLLSRFCNSALEKIEEIPHEDRFLKMVKEYWEQMIDINSSVKMIHDGYLKLYHLTKPKLNFDYILVDEAQDSNEVMLDIVYSQSGKKVFVGDEHQRIYSFRGALNVFTENPYFSDEHDYVFLHLTKSFRFGEEIANIANKLLSYYKQEEVLLVGNEDRDSTVGIIDKSMQHCIITRTNSHLFDLAVKYANEEKTLHINGGFESFINQIMNGYYLYVGEIEKITNENLKKFKTFKKFKAVSEYLKYPEYTFLVKIVERYGEGLLNHINKIKRHLTGIKTADIILSTAHKSKGLEFVSVVISDDFFDLFDKNGNIIPVDRIDLEEINLLYVAITRATHELELSTELERFIAITNSK